MSSPSLARLFVRWEEALENGQELSPEELCGDRRELIDELRRGIEALRRMRQKTTPASEGDNATLPPADDPDATMPPAPTSATAAGGVTPAGYEVVGELGRGGMGVVYRARQVALNRPCALKMILMGGHAGGTNGCVSWETRRQSPG